MEKILANHQKSQGAINIEIPKEKLVSIINKNFPDFRNTIMDVQSFIETGDISSTQNVSNKLKIDLYELIFDKTSSYSDIYHFLMNNFGQDKVDVMLKLLERPFVDWSMKEGKDVNKLFKANRILTINFPLLDTSTDPIILGMNVIGELRELFID